MELDLSYHIHNNSPLVITFLNRTIIYISLPYFFKVRCQISWHVPVLQIFLLPSGFFPIHNFYFNCFICAYVVQILYRVEFDYVLFSDGKTQILVKKDLWPTVICTYHCELSRLLYYTLWLKQVYMFLLIEKSNLHFE